MRRGRCNAANGDIAHKPMRGVTLLRRRRSRCIVARRIWGENTHTKSHSSMDVVTLCDYAARRFPGGTCIYTMFDVDLFIQCINTRPALWEKSAKKYSDKNCKEKSWIEIGEIMYGTQQTF